MGSGDYSADDRKKKMTSKIYSNDPKRRKKSRNKRDDSKDIMKEQMMEMMGFLKSLSDDVNCKGIKKETAY
jgi:hypothetical protein